MRYLYMLSLFFMILPACQPKPTETGSTGKKDLITTGELKDKIRGGWAGQVIGCTYGGPTEFSHPGTLIRDYQEIPWDSTRISWYFDNSPGLYDDVYMDLTFMEVMEKEGLDAPASSHAVAFANAPYPLWHANQAARYNILNGIQPPESGHWKNNPHANDIDFQIEADFAGLMTPGMPASATEICDRIGHIMNYGDGWYGGVYIAVMYSLAFVSESVEQIVEEALRAIPAESEFYRCINAVLSVYREDPGDWKKAWFEVERNWASDIGCPDGVFRPFNIDATVNAAYVVIGLLYGQGDFDKTIDIATRCGQDSDCNPASAGGILGTMTGYSAIPEKWKGPLKPIVDKPFSYTSLSLNTVYETGYRHALEMIRKNGGTTEGDQIRIPIQPVKTVPFEVCFHDLAPVSRKSIGTSFTEETEVQFSGTGFTLTGYPTNIQYGVNDVEDVIQVQMILDGKPAEQFTMPVSYLKRRLEIAWKFDLPAGEHTLKLRILNPRADRAIRLADLITYRDI